MEPVLALVSSKRAADPEPHPEKWDQRRRLQELLDLWQDIFAVNLVRTGGDGSNVPQLSEATRHPSVIELGRCLKALAVAERIPHRHVVAYRITVEWRITNVLEKRKRPSGKTELALVRRQQRLMPNWVDPQQVAAGESWLEREFDGSVSIPEPYWSILTGKA